VNDARSNRRWPPCSSLKAKVNLIPQQSRRLEWERLGEAVCETFLAALEKQKHRNAAPRERRRH
jgi:hypothetical protein